MTMNNPNRFIRGLSDYTYQVIDNQLNRIPIIVNGPDPRKITIPLPQTALESEIDIHKIPYDYTN